MHAPGPTQFAFQPSPAGSTLDVGATPMANWPQAPQVATGPAIAVATQARVRWERIVLVIAGVSILAVVGAKVTASAMPHATSRHAAHAPADQASLTAAPAHAMHVRGAGAPPSPAIAHHNMTSTHRAATHRPAGHVAATAQRSHMPSHVTRPSHAANHAASPHRMPATRAATPSMAHHRGAMHASMRMTPARVAVGAGRGQLPRTGAPVWLAALLGLGLVLVGLSAHVNAVRIGAATLLYRRGPLLRPIAGASTVLEHVARLASAPRPVSDFTTTHVHRGPIG